MQIPLLAIVIPSAIILTVAYLVYGRILSRLLKLDPTAQTPAVTLRDDVDYVPIEPKFLLSQHFSAIAAAGPIAGPIIAGIAFGWAPALAWILIGAIFIGGIHDMTALVASIRHQARSIAEVVREHMSRRSFLLFLVFVWLALIYIIVAFTDITAASFVGALELESGQRVLGSGIATSSLLYLALPIVMGLLLRYARMPLWLATLIFVPLVGVVIWVGQEIPLDLASLLDISDAQAHKVWDVILLGYCLVAAVMPMWLLLQPRGHLGGFFLYVALGGSALGLLFGGKTIQYPAFKGWTSSDGQTLAPFLFVLIACGACSGFHSLIASGTTSKQLKRETDAKAIGYGTMLLEAMVAIVSLCCVMMLAQSSPLVTGRPQPNFIYAQGIGSLLAALTFDVPGVGRIGIPAGLGVAFALMAFTTFVYDTLDVCTRLGRYIIQELTGWHDAKGKWLGTILTAVTPLFFVTRTAFNRAGDPIPIWRKFWDLFGASNQLLAALTLLGVTVWLWRIRRAWWVWIVTGIPTVWMYCVSVWALVLIVQSEYENSGMKDPITWIGVVLVVLAGAMLVEAFLVFFGPRGLPPPSPRRQPAPAAV